ncbi:MAG: hypothetical protein ACRCXT_17635 [Paraclostridium sp.]
MEWFSVESLEELKALGSLNKLREDIKNDVGDNIKLTGRGWNDVYNNIVNFRDLVNKINQHQQINHNPEEYFTSPANEYIFYLTELDGELRMKKLGITITHFSNKKKAKAWRDKISKSIHPDVNNHPKANLAMTKLNEMYTSMVGNE